MALIGKIRNRSGLLIGAIGVAMVLFIGGELFRGNNNLFGAPDTSVGEIAGSKISVQEYQKRLDQAAEGQSLSADQMEQVRNRVWNVLMRERLVNPEYNKLGIQVTDDELWDQIKNNPRNPILTQFFTNPQTGQIYEQLLDPATGGLKSDMVLYYIKQTINGDNPANWYPVEDAIVNTRLSEKYNGAIKSGLMVTSFDAQQKSEEDNKRVNLSFAGMNYNEVSDEEISYDESDLQAYYNAHRNESEYKQKETNRGARVVVWNAVPSDEDISNIEKETADLIEAFKTAENDTSFILENSDDKSPRVFETMSRYQMPEEVDSILFSAPDGEVMGPYSIGGAFRITKKLGIKMMPDSVRARHILIQMNQDVDSAKARATIDSLKEAIDNGADFAVLAKDFSADIKSGQAGGDLDWFTQGQMVPEFNDACFSGKVGDMPIVLTQFGFHLIEITDKTEDKERALIASVVRFIEPSQETLDRIYNSASEFAIQNNSMESFVEAAEANPELNVQQFEFIREGDKTLGSLENPRPVIRWVYDSEVGEVSEVYEMGNSFVVVAVSSIKNKGVLPFEEVKDKVEEEVKKEKKAEVIRAKIEGESTVDGVAGKLGKTVQNADNINFASFSIPGIGPEPKILGLAFGMAEGQTSSVIAGDNGVYIVRVDKVIPAEDASNIDLLSDQLARGYNNRVDFEVFEALKERAGVVDQRHKFY